MLRIFRRVTANRIFYRHLHTTFGLYVSLSFYNDDDDSFVGLYDFHIAFSFAFPLTPHPYRLAHSQLACVYIHEMAFWREQNWQHYSMNKMATHNDLESTRVVSYSISIHILFSRFLCERRKVIRRGYSQRKPHINVKQNIIHNIRKRKDARPYRDEHFA